jgi:hypothetical protein
MTTPSGKGAGAIHMHSDYSHDGLDSLEAMREMCLVRGIHFVGLTDHAEDFVPELFGEYVQHCAAVSDEQVRFIPGLEFRFPGLRGVHLLALGLRTWIAPHSAEEFFELTRTEAQLTLLAHPMLARYNIPQIVLDHIDGIEVWNANYNTRYLPDPQAMRLCHDLSRIRPGVVATAGLDQHDGSNDRELRVILQDPSAAEPLLEIKSGRFSNSGRTMQFDSRASLSPGRMRLLKTARWAFDVCERTQDRVAHSMYRMRRRA